MAMVIYVPEDENIEQLEQLRRRVGKVAAFSWGAG
jgi:hypothetical protein